MKVALASRYRGLMLVLFPITLGIGTAVLWLLSLNWPLSIDEAGLTFRHRRCVKWDAVRKIGLSRSYLDGRVSQIRIHHDRGMCKIPVQRLEDGQQVARTIVAMFEQVKRSRVFKNLARTEATMGRENIGSLSLMQVRRQSMAVGDFSQVNVSQVNSPQVDVNLWGAELAALRATLARRSKKIQAM